MAVAQCLYKHIIAGTSVCLHAGNPLTQQLHVPCFCVPVNKLAGASTEKNTQTTGIVMIMAPNKGDNHQTYPLEEAERKER